MATSPFGGGRSLLAPGVIVRSVHAAANHTSMWNEVVVELSVDPQQIDAMDRLMRGLTDLINGAHPSQASHSMTGPTITYPPPSGDSNGIDVEELLGIERDPEAIDEEVTLLTIKDLIEERFDGLDSALRLAVGE